MFVYDAVLEALLAGNTTIPRSNYHSTYEAMLTHEKDEKSPMEKQHEVIHITLTFSFVISSLSIFSLH